MCYVRLDRGYTDIRFLRSLLNKYVTKLYYKDCWSIRPVQWSQSDWSLLCRCLEPPVSDQQQCRCHHFPNSNQRAPLSSRSFEVHSWYLAAHVYGTGVTLGFPSMCQCLGHLPALSECWLDSFNYAGEKYGSLLTLNFLHSLKRVGLHIHGARDLKLISFCLRPQTLGGGFKQGLSCCWFVVAAEAITMLPSLSAQLWWEHVTECTNLIPLILCIWH